MQKKCSTLESFNQAVPGSFCLFALLKENLSETSEMECQQSRGCLEKATSNVCQRQADKLLQFTYSDPDIQFGYTLVQSAWLFVDCKGNVSWGKIQDQQGYQEE